MITTTQILRQETDSTVSGHLLAASIYGPSYLSFEFALSWHGLIPEAVYNCTAATFGKKKRRHTEMHLACICSEMSQLTSSDLGSKSDMKMTIHFSLQVPRRQSAISCILFHRLIIRRI